MRLPLLFVGSLFLALSGCVAPTGPVEVSRFIAPDAPLGRGSVLKS